MVNLPSGLRHASGRSGLDRGAPARRNRNKTGDQQPEKQPVAGARIGCRRTGGGQRDIVIGDGIEAGMRQDPARRVDNPADPIIGDANQRQPFFHRAGAGDRADLSLTAEDQALVAKMARSGVRVVMIVLSGRPLILGDVVDSAAAIVAAWLPGTEGHGVADVLFGDHQPTGRLSVTWPRSTAQEPINVGDARYAPLYPFGFGLTY